STSGRTHCGIGSPATANAVAWGGGQWATALTAGRFLYTARGKRISLLRLRVAGICLPSISPLHMSSPFMNPFDIIVRAHSTSLSPMRMLMLPSLAAAKPLAYTRRPISQICSLSLYSFMLFVHQVIPFDPGDRPGSFRFVNNHPVEQAGAVGIDWPLLRVE